jgi:uncharacterized membrane protein YdfJ with MMPL/SSD domain
MSRTTRRPVSLAARAGRWSARHRRTAILGWLLFVVLATVVGGAVGQRNVPQAQMGNGESRRGDMIVAGADFPKQTQERILVQGRHDVTARDPQVAAAVRDVVGRLRRIHGIRGIEDPLAPGRRAGATSRDGRSLVVSFMLPGAADANGTRVEAPLAAVAAVRAAHPAVGVDEFGDASLTKGLADAEATSTRASELGSIPVALVILLVAFGALVAAGVPLLLGITAVVATLGLLGPLSQLTPLTPFAGLVVALIGLAVGVDYAMFYLRRAMEEYDNGRSPDAAIDVAAATSGRAILVSGMTVIVAMAGMLVAGNALFASFAIGTILVVAVAVLGSLTFLPAMLSFLSAKGWIEKGRVPWIGRRRHANHGESRVWNAILDRVLARPLVAAVLAGGLLIGLAVPALGMHLKQAGTDGYSRSVPVIRAYDRMQAAFPGGAVPAVTVVKAGDVTRPEVRDAIRRLHDRALATGRLIEPSHVEVSPDKTVATIALAVKGNGTDAASRRSIDVLRNDVVPATVGRLPGAEVAVTGVTASSQDFVDVMHARLPIVFAFVLGLAFVLLLVTFRSIVVPIKAIVLNLLSVGAAYGVLVLVFQDGLGERLLGFRSVGGIASGLPLFLFVILFGLSMDYHVFVLSRVREAVNRGMSTDDAVGHGIKTTAGVVTSAAAVMVAVFSAFALSPSQEAKQMGVGLAAAILIDATIVRAILLPATMKLLGRRNWYLPARLSWLPSLEAEPAPAPAA